MAKKITDLASLPSADSTDVLPIVDVSTNTTKQTTVAGVASAVAANIPDGSITSDMMAATSGSANTATSGSTTSSSYTATLTAGGTNPSVTIDVPISGKVVVNFYAAMGNSSATAFNSVALAYSGANSYSPSGAGGDPLSIRAVPTTGTVRHSASFLLTGLTPGSTTFTLQYMTNTGTATFSDRRISAMAA